MKWALASLGLVAASVVAFAESPAETAASMLGEAALKLEAAEKATDRIAALTDTVRAYEAGLSAMREGLVAGALRKRELEHRLADENQELARLLVLLQSVSKHGSTEALIHPGGLSDTINAGLMVSALVPDLQARADRVGADLDELTELTAIQDAGITTLDNGARDAREAREKLATALENRSELPPQSATDQAAMMALLNSAETLEAFASALLPQIEGDRPIRASSWIAPVEGEIWRGFNAADAAGVRRPGLLFAAPSEGLVVAPVDAITLFSGEIPDQGVVLVLEPQAGQIVILAGLSQSFSSPGQVVAQGDALGILGGETLGAQEKLNEILRNGSLLGQETLYMEVRQGRGPIDPASLLVPGDT